MYRHKLTDVPDSVLKQPSGIKKQMRWQADYNVAAWFRFDRVAQQPIRLQLFWHDDSGQHSMNIDQTNVNASSLLLSGIAKLKVNGPLQAMSIIVECEHHDYRVDELFVQPAANPAQTAQRAQS
ncbi:hypothetical protein [Reinekea blandensis]|uniref:Uncharacterized protein n=1 Tax=Reinekea blandensis MED297 TaxID=314283 RepID=A4BAF2_9GAMM|nr:hypothetical protein [Reinekea blandensis]EAR10908.1 hypothetical protein MED297_10371 [Reinekea sp. MED297] [Reinekea blandensis MED297]